MYGRLPHQSATNRTKTFLPDDIEGDEEHGGAGEGDEEEVDL
jgi:hypothetical protein